MQIGTQTRVGRSGWMVVALFIATLSACGAPLDTSGADASASFSFSSGFFQLESHSVQDMCLDGALKLILMPLGENTPYPFEELTELPGLSAESTTMSLQIQEPFGAVPVTIVKTADYTMSINGATQTDVVIDPDAYGDCMVDVTIDATISVIDSDHVTLTIDSRLTNWRAETGQCPQVLGGDPCQVKLNVSGVRQ